MQPRPLLPLLLQMEFSVREAPLGRSSLSGLLKPLVARCLFRLAHYLQFLVELYKVEQPRWGDYGT